ncbi:MAG: hypothetical protein IKS20_12285 [Victivallales bacterium]|nr:hypothetical protein [Victivallales bacterium]
MRNPISLITVNPGNAIGIIKPMHCVNNGPVCRRIGNHQYFKAAGIPYVRYHDTAHCGAYGGPHVVDVCLIFPDMSREPEDASAYDFQLTDELIQHTLAADSKVFYRLGASIEHWSKKYNTLPPKDFKKWAAVCAKIIEHYNYGWNNGFHHNIEYWEIWNEPDLRESMPAHQRPTWGGTAQEFFELYSITAKLLKERFPEIKVGGPAVSSPKTDWTGRFLKYLSQENERVPLDFFSWHRYTTEPLEIQKSAVEIRKVLDNFGYPETECILDEYNYVLDWIGEDYIYSFQTIANEKGAAFTAACFIAGQNSPLDMLMYYDARPGTPFNGMFDHISKRPLKGYYPFLYFSQLYKLGMQIQCDCDDQSIFALAAKDKDTGKTAMLVAYYTDELEAKPKNIHINLDKYRDFDCRIVDATRMDGPFFPTWCPHIENWSENHLEFTLNPQSVLLLMEK